MIELVQFPWSPFCVVQRRILEFSGVSFRKINIPTHDRSLVWKLTRQRYHGVPIVREGKSVVFELNEESQVIAKYLDSRFKLDLFPWDIEGVQSILWRYTETEVEGIAFKLNDIYWKEFVPSAHQLPFLRHKERKFGPGCLLKWKADQKQLLAQLEQKLIPFEEMLLHRDYLLGDQPRFVDFDLYGMLANFLYSGHYRLPRPHSNLKDWYDRIARVKFPSFAREKELHT